MRATRVLRCTRCTGSSSGRRSAWTLGHFWDERAYLASPNAKKLLMTVAVMAALGYTSATATTNPPATVIGSAGTLQYAAHNIFVFGASAYANWFAAGGTASDGGAGNAINGFQTRRFSAATALHGYYSPCYTPPSGERFVVAHLVAFVYQLPQDWRSMRFSNKRSYRVMTSLMRCVPVQETISLALR
jgi:hypothetical protein